jgi:hypothetical protein
MRNKRGFLFLIPWIILAVILMLTFLFGWLFVDKAINSVKESGMTKYLIWGGLFGLIIIFRAQLGAVLNALLGLFKIRVKV